MERSPLRFDTGVDSGVAAYKRRTIFIGAVALAAMFVVFFAASVRYTSRPQFCATCHEMTPEYITWSVSSHSKVGCVRCHVEPGLGNLLKHKLAGLKQVYQHVRGDTERPFPRKEIPSEVCMGCHSVSREVTASGDLQVPHEKHIQIVGATCSKCHRAVAHATLAEKEKVDYSPAALDQLKELPVKDFRPRMSLCMTECHVGKVIDGKVASYKCEFCHKEVKTPATHQDRQWPVKHGGLAKKMVEDCIFCHTVAVGKLPPKGEKTLAAIVRGSEFCINCHTKLKPPSHNPEWPLEHANRARADRTGCTACHDWEKPQPNSPTANVIYCTTCHGAEAHPSTWRQDHPTVVKTKGFTQCFQCHGAMDCRNCHQANKVKVKI